MRRLLVPGGCCPPTGVCGGSATFVPAPGGGWSNVRVASGRPDGSHPCTNGARPFPRVCLAARVLAIYRAGARALLRAEHQALRQAPGPDATARRHGQTPGPDTRSRHQTPGHQNIWHYPPHTRTPHGNVAPALRRGDISGVWLLARDWWPNSAAPAQWPLALSPEPAPATGAMRYIIVNTNAAVVRALERCWAQAAASAGADVRVEVFHGTVAAFLAAYRPDCGATVVAPANSVSFMGGGYDRALLEALGAPALDYRRVEAALQTRARARFRGYIPPATVHPVEVAAAFADAGVPFHTTAAHAKRIHTLLLAPTMVVPKPTTPQCVFDCVWNVLAAADTATVILPAFGAGYGRVAPETVARVMAGAVALFHAPLAPLARTAAVLVFLGKDYRLLEVARDVRAVERHLSPYGRAHADARTAAPDAGAEWPMPWPQLVRCVPALAAAPPDPDA